MEDFIVFIIASEGNKPAAQAAGADPSRCISAIEQNSPELL